MKTRIHPYLLAVAGILSCFAMSHLHADEIWTAVSLHPSGATSSEAKAVSTAGQFGYGVFGGLSKAMKWNGSATGFVSLDPSGASNSQVLAASGNIQGGFGTFGMSSQAGIWAGDSASFAPLHATGNGSVIHAVSGSQQGGTFTVGSNPLFFPHAGIWNGSILNFVDLHPVAATASEVYGTNGTRQVGYVNIGSLHAVLWSGTIASIIDLHPAGATGSIAYGIDATKQVGEATFGGNNHAGIWFGNAAFTDLHPAGFVTSSLRSTDGNRQAGFVTTVAGSLAGVWSGTAASFVSLHTFLPADYGTSEAYCIRKIGSTTFVCGKANHTALMHDEAMLWTLTGPDVKALGKTRLTTKRPSLRMRGTSTNASKVQVKVGKAKAVKATGTNTWTQTARLKKGVNRILVQSVNSFGDLSKASVVTVTRT